MKTKHFPKCYKAKRTFFGNVKEWNEHEWFYKGVHKERVCKYCKLTQIYFGTNYRYDFGIEDWRNKSK